MPRMVLPIALLVLVLLTAGCLGSAVQTSTSGSATNQTIDVSATGSATAAPDLAKVDVAVEVRADTANAAREQVATDVARMRSAIRGIGIPDSAVHTTAFSVGPEYEYHDGTRTLVGYRAYHAIEIESDVDAVGQVIDTAVANGASQVQGVQFTLTDATQRQLRDQAITAAMTNAHRDAATIAAAGNVSVGPLTSASTASVTPIPYQKAVPEAGGSSGASTVVEPGPVTVTATVQVAYALR